MNYLLSLPEQIFNLSLNPQALDETKLLNWEITKQKHSRLINATFCSDEEAVNTAQYSRCAARA